MSRTCSSHGVIPAIALLAYVLGSSWLLPGVFAQETTADFIATADRILAETPSFPDALERAIPIYRTAIERDPNNPIAYRKLAWSCFEFGELAEEDPLEWYRCGQEAAERSLALDEANADAHFLFAATTGLLAAQLPFWRVSPTTPLTLEQHLSRALALDSEHARALNMMGMLLNEVPGPLRALMEGEKEQAEGYLTRAVEVAPNSTRVRLLLAEYYHELGRPELAEEQAQRIIAETAPEEPWLWRHKHKPDAEALLKAME